MPDFLPTLTSCSIVCLFLTGRYKTNLSTRPLFGDRKYSFGGDKDILFLHFVLSKAPAKKKKKTTHKNPKRGSRRKREKKSYLRHPMICSQPQSFLHSSKYTIVIFIAAAMRHGPVVVLLVVLGIRTSQSSHFDISFIRDSMRQWWRL